MPKTSADKGEDVPREELPPGMKRLNVVLSTWGHRDLKMAAARDLGTMKNVLLASIVKFSELDEDERQTLYDEVAKRNAEEVARLSK